MKGELKEHWLKLCEQAATEQDSEKLIELIEEINRLLQEKEERLKSSERVPLGALNLLCALTSSDCPNPVSHLL